MSKLNASRLGLVVSEIDEVSNSLRTISRAVLQPILGSELLGRLDIARHNANLVQLEMIVPDQTRTVGAIEKALMAVLREADIVEAEAEVGDRVSIAWVGGMRNAVASIAIALDMDSLL